MPLEVAGADVTLFPSVVTLVDVDLLVPLTGDTAAGVGEPEAALERLLVFLDGESLAALVALLVLLEGELVAAAVLALLSLAGAVTEGLREGDAALVLLRVFLEGESGRAVSAALELLLDDLEGDDEGLELVLRFLVDLDCLPEAEGVDTMPPGTALLKSEKLSSKVLSITKWSLLTLSGRLEMLANRLPSSGKASSSISSILNP